MTLTILSLEDEADVRDALERDLEQFWDKIRLEVAEDVDDAWAVIDEILEDGDELALVLSDHRLPGKSGVDFLVELMKDERFSATRTVLVTGQADQSDTIRAVNQAGLDYYIGKPWNPDELRAVVRDQLTEYVLESGVNPLPYVSVLDAVRVMRQTGFSRIPIYHENIDRIVGIAHIKDLLEPALDQHDSDEKIARFVRSAHPAAPWYQEQGFCLLALPLLHAAK